MGFKFKLADFQNRYTYRKRPFKATRTTAPTLSDIHVIGYGSGLLYQVNWLNSEETFRSPLLGASIGASFFNGLDMHFGYAAQSNTRFFMDGHWNFSVDVRISDYLSELNKRRKQKQSE